MGTNNNDELIQSNQQQSISTIPSSLFGGERQLDEPQNSNNLEDGGRGELSMNDNAGENMQMPAAYKALNSSNPAGSSGGPEQQEGLIAVGGQST